VDLFFLLFACLTRAQSDFMPYSTVRTLKNAAKDRVKDVLSLKYDLWERYKLFITLFC
jgi:hypothetical protein